MVTVMAMRDQLLELLDTARWITRELHEIARETVFDHPVLLAIAVFIGCTAAALSVL